MRFSEYSANHQQQRLGESKSAAALAFIFRLPFSTPEAQTHDYDLSAIDGNFHINSLIN